MEEIWKDIPGYEEHYKVSNFGRVKSLKNKKERILNPSLGSSGYLEVNLYKKNKCKHIMVHKLITEVFLNHKSSEVKLVVNHINFNKTDNRVENLEVITQRENTNKKHLKSSSKYTGVRLRVKGGFKKWEANIYYNGNLEYLGLFKNELDAHNAYQNRLKQII